MHPDVGSVGLESADADYIVCPGVTIGDNSAIGAGSVVAKDIPKNVVAVGDLCRVLWSIV